MNIAYRVAKVAALLFMTVALAVFVSCNLAGDQGDTGDTGTTGGRGLQGPMGDPGTSGTGGSDVIGPLFARGGMTPWVIWVKQPDAATQGEPPATADLSERFRGGESPITYKLSTDDADITDGDFEVALDEDGMATGIVKLTKKETTNGADSKFVLIATDAEGAVARLNVEVRNNLWPALGTGLTLEPITVGTQDVKPTPARTQCPMPNLNVCEFTVIVIDGGDNAHFSDEDPENLVLMHDNGGGANIRVSITDLTVTFTGLTSTFDPDAGNGEQAPKTIKVTAMDSRGRTAPATVTPAVELAFMVTVDGEPVEKEPLPTLSSVKVQEDAHIVIRSIQNFFEDPEGQGLTITAESDQSAVAEAGVSSNNLEITANAPGTATITVKATETSGLGQSVSQTVKVTVTN
jgi:hypothetical protein